MPRSRLSPSDDDFIMNMKKAEYSNREIAKKLKVNEGTIRYRIKRERSDREDGRKRKPSALDRFRAVIAQWIADYEDSRRRPTLLFMDGCGETMEMSVPVMHFADMSANIFRNFTRREPG